MRRAVLGAAARLHRRVLPQRRRQTATLGEVSAREMVGAARYARRCTQPAPPVGEAWGWRVSNTPGSDFVTISRSESGVDVTVLPSLSFRDDTAHGGQCAEVFDLAVVVTTRRGAVRFECISADCTLRVVTASTFPAPRSPEEDVSDTALSDAFVSTPAAEQRRHRTYHVPDWDDQSDAVLTGFQRTLETLGVTSDFLDFAASLLQYKEAAESAAWWAKLNGSLTDPTPQSDPQLPRLSA